MRPTRLALCLSALAFVTACPPKKVDGPGDRPRVEVKPDAKADAAKVAKGERPKGDLTDAEKAARRALRTEAQKAEDDKK